MRIRRIHVLLFVLVLVVWGALFPQHLERILAPITRKRPVKKTVEDRVAQFGRVADARWYLWFKAAGVVYHPDQLMLVGFKHEKRLEVYATGLDKKSLNIKSSVTNLRFIRSYPILGSSGVLGPKLQKGDLQVPEEFYRIESLNPNSLYHLSLWVSYPNAFDRKQAEIEGRTWLGEDI